MDREMENRNQAVQDFEANESIEMPSEEKMDDMYYFMVLLKAIREAVLEGKGVGNWKLVNVKKCLDILDDLDQNLPDAIQYGLQMYSDRERIMGNSENEARDRINEADRRARASLESAKAESERIIKDAEEEAAAILADANERADQLVSDSEIIIRAREEAHVMKNDARVEASEMRLKANHDVLQMLMGVEDDLSEAFNNISRRRKELDAEDK